MRRRQFIGVLGGAATWPFAARARQAERMRQIGVVMSFAADDPESQLRMNHGRKGAVEFRCAAHGQPSTALSLVDAKVWLA